MFAKMIKVLFAILMAVLLIGAPAAEARSLNGYGRRLQSTYGRRLQTTYGRRLSGYGRRLNGYGRRLSEAKTARSMTGSNLFEN